MSLLEHMQELLTDPNQGDVLLVPRSPGEEERPIGHASSPGTGDGASGWQAEGSGFRVFSHILARCPVFRRMFAQEFKEGCERRAEVQVSSPKILEQLLRYLYTDQMDFSPEVGEAWALADLFELAALIDMYEAPRGATQAVLSELAWKVKEGGVEAALEALDMATKCPIVCQLLGDQQIAIALAETLNKKGGFGASFKATQQGMLAGLPQHTMEQIVGCLEEELTFGHGQLLQVVAWCQEMAPRYTGAAGSPETILDNLKWACLEKVTGEVEALWRELGRVSAKDAEMAPPVPTDAPREEVLSVSRSISRGLVLTTCAQRASQDSQRQCWLCDSRRALANKDCKLCNVRYCNDLLSQELKRLARMHAASGWSFSPQTMGLSAAMEQGSTSMEVAWSTEGRWSSVEEPVVPTTLASGLLGGRVSVVR